MHGGRGKIASWGKMIYCTIKMKTAVLSLTTPVKGTLCPFHCCVYLLPLLARMLNYNEPSGFMPSPRLSSWFKWQDPSTRPHTADINDTNSQATFADQCVAIGTAVSGMDFNKHRKKWKLSLPTENRRFGKILKKTQEAYKESEPKKYIY